MQGNSNRFVAHNHNHFQDQLDPVQPGLEREIQQKRFSKKYSSVNKSLQIELEANIVCKSSLVRLDLINFSLFRTFLTSQITKS